MLNANIMYNVLLVDLECSLCEMFLIHCVLDRYLIILPNVSNCSLRIELLSSTYRIIICVTINLSLELFVN